MPAALLPQYPESRVLRRIQHRRQVDNAGDKALDACYLPCNAAYIKSQIDRQWEDPCAADSAFEAHWNACRCCLHQELPNRNPAEGLLASNFQHILEICEGSGGNKLRLPASPCDFHPNAPTPPIATPFPTQTVWDLRPPQDSHGIGVLSTMELAQLRMGRVGQGQGQAFQEVVSTTTPATDETQSSVPTTLDSTVVTTTASPGTGATSLATTSPVTDATSLATASPSSPSSPISPSPSPSSSSHDPAPPTPTSPKEPHHSGLEPSMKGLIGGIGGSVFLLVCLVVGYLLRMWWRRRARARANKHINLPSKGKDLGGDKESQLTMLEKNPKEGEDNEDDEERRTATELDSKEVRGPFELHSDSAPASPVPSTPNTSCVSPLSTAPSTSCVSPLSTAPSTSWGTGRRGGQVNQNDAYGIFGSGRSGSRSG